MTARPWPEAVEPTTEEFLSWFLEQSTEAQAWLLMRLRERAHEGDVCFMKNHGPRLDAAEAELAAARAENERLRAGIEAIADEWDRRDDRLSQRARFTKRHSQTRTRDLRALLAGVSS